MAKVIRHQVVLASKIGIDQNFLADFWDTIYNFVFHPVRKIPASFSDPLNSIGEFCALVVFLPALILLQKDRKSPDEIRKILIPYFEDWGYCTTYCKSFLNTWGKERRRTKVSNTIFRALLDDADMPLSVPSMNGSKEILTNVFWRNALSTFRDIYHETSQNRAAQEYYEEMEAVFSNKSSNEEESSVFSTVFDSVTENVESTWELIKCKLGFE